LEILDITYTKASIVPPLPPELLCLYVYNTPITKLPKRLPLKLRELSCENTPITQLPPLPRSLKWVWISPWQIGSCLNNLKNLKTRIKIVN
jgi:Leucine-rich repeat (LRR) protein